MSDGKKNKHRKKGFFSNYFIKIFSFLAIALAITIVTIIVAMPTAVNYVHKAEAGLGRSIRYVTVDDSTYAPVSEKGAKPDKNNIAYGDCVANIECESTGVNCKVYYGTNRISMRSGAGLSGDEAFFGETAPVFVTGYDETYFSGLKYCKSGDIIKVTTNYGELSYRVSEVTYIDKSKQAFKPDTAERLVLCAICSDFSEHADENLYVFAERTEGEVD